MDRFTFVPSTGQFFLWSRGISLKPANLAPTLPGEGILQRLAKEGWPATAHVICEGKQETLEGVLVELLDALPLLACLPPGQATVEGVPEMEAYSLAAHFALELVSRGRLGPKLRSRRSPSRFDGDSGAIVGWEARWQVLLGTAEERARAARLSSTLLRPEFAVPRARGPRTYTPAGLVRRLLDASADTLVREATRRGAYIRLGGWPADAWEQRLVRSLVDDRAGFSANLGGPSPQEALCALAKELKAWTDDQISSQSLLPSPPSWQAGESLQRVVDRMIAPARFLAECLKDGRPAPRTLTPALLPQQSRISQAIVVAHTALKQQANSPLAPAQTPDKGGLKGGEGDRQAG